MQIAMVGSLSMYLQTAALHSVALLLWDETIWLMSQLLTAGRLKDRLILIPPNQPKSWKPSNRRNHAGSDGCAVRRASRGAYRLSSPWGWRCLGNCAP